MTSEHTTPSCLANRTSTVPENLEMQRFMYWARVLGENQYLRHT
jgi:hypothetical protein